MGFSLLSTLYIMDIFRGYRYNLIERNKTAILKPLSLGVPFIHKLCDFHYYSALENYSRNQHSGSSFKVGLELVQL